MTYYIIIRGPLGCGKSTISKKLSKIFKAKYFTIDRVLDEYDLTKHKEKCYIAQKSFFKANEIISKRAEEFLRRGVPVIFDGNFYWKSQIKDLIKRINYQHYVFTLKAPLKVCISRDAHRKKTHGADAAEAVYKKSTEFNYGNVIDATKSINEIIKKIKFYVLKKR